MPNPMRKKTSGSPPTMEDVALSAGVSHQTVSRVLNDHPHVSERTKKNVLAAIEELGYRRNASARSLVTRSAQIIGAVIVGLGQYGPSNTLLGLQEAALEDDYLVSVVGARNPGNTAIRESLDHLLGHPLDGIIVVAPYDSALALTQDLKLPVPMVIISAGEQTVANMVGVNQTLGAHLAVRHLIAHGHRAIAHLAGPAEWTESRQRLTGWETELANHGLPPGELLVGDWSAESGYRQGLEFDVAKTSAIFAANDQMALGLMRALHERGLRVPEDISVVGFDDQPEASHFFPPLTTVSQDFHGLGRRGLDVLVSQIEGTAFAGETLLKPTLVIRGSTGPAPAK